MKHRNNSSPNPSESPKPKSTSFFGELIENSIPNHEHNNIGNMCMKNPSFSSSLPPSLFVENYIHCDPLIPTLLDNQYNNSMVGDAMEDGYYGDYKRILEPKEVRDFCDFSHPPSLGNGDLEEIKVLPNINNSNINNGDINNQFNHNCFNYTNDHMSFKVDTFGNNYQNMIQENLKIGNWDLEDFIKDLSCFPIEILD